MYSEGIMRFRDCNSPDGVEDLCRDLSLYWKKRGFPNARFWPEREHVGFLEANKPRFIWGVRSNLINGVPPK